MAADPVDLTGQSQMDTLELPRMVQAAGADLITLETPLALEALVHDGRVIQVSHDEFAVPESLLPASSSTV